MAALPADLRTVVMRADRVMALLALTRDEVLFGATPELVNAASEFINGQWAAMKGRHDIETWRRVELMAAVDLAAKTEATGDAASETVLRRLPPDLVEVIAPHRVALPPLVDEWRRPARRAGRPPRGVARRPDKWDLLAALWKQATGVDIEPGTWKTDWHKVKPANPGSK
jgi:hypothetical protein